MMAAASLPWLHPFDLAGRAARAPFWGAFFAYVALLGEVTIAFQGHWVGVVGLLPAALALLSPHSVWTAGLSWMMVALQIWGGLCLLAGAIRRLRDAGHTPVVLSACLLVAVSLLLVLPHGGDFVVLWPLWASGAVLAVWLLAQLLHSGRPARSVTRQTVLF